MITREERIAIDELQYYAALKADQVLARHSGGKLLALGGEAYVIRQRIANRLNAGNEYRAIDFCWKHDPTYPVRVLF
jgi:hypothetical protein